MKLRVLGITAAALLASAILAGPSRAQTPRTLKGNIPFAFSVGEKTLPAGDYTVQRVQWGNEIAQMIRSADGSSAAMVGTMRADWKGEGTEARLIFHRYGNQYFLAQIWYGADSGRELSRSRREKEAASGEAPTEVAVVLGASVGQP